MFVTYIYKKQTNATEVPPWSRRDLIFRVEDAVPAAAHMQRQSPAPGSGAWGCTASLFLYPHSQILTASFNAKDTIKHRKKKKNLIPLILQHMN